MTDETSYKDKLIHKAVTYGSKVLANISKRAGIYTYFFVHGTKFLKNGGRFGFIVSNAWLDVEYGAGLQEFFLKNYKIVAIIESKVERWFRDADINTVIVILEKADRNDQKIERNENLVRFVYLLKPLRHFIPSAQSIWEKQIERKQAIENLIRTILGHDEFYQNDELHIYPKKQSELWEEGFNPEEQKYVGAKWGKYLRGPKIFFKILGEKGNKIVRLGDIAEISTVSWSRQGENEMLMSKKSLGKPKVNSTEVIKSPKDISKIKITTFHTLYFLKLVKGIKEQIIYAPLLWVDLRGDKHICHLCLEPIAFTHNFHGINPYDKKLADVLCAVLNSTLTWLFIEVLGRQGLGGGAVRVLVEDLRTQFPILNPSNFTSRDKTNLINAFSRISDRKIDSVFDELGASVPEEVSLDKIKSDRRALDQVIMGDILGFHEEEQLEVYRAVIDLVKSRIERAKSVGPKHKTKKGIDVQTVVEIIVNQIGEKNLKEWYREKVLTRSDLAIKKLSDESATPEIEKSLFGWQVRTGKRTILCRSEAEARYLKTWSGAGAKSIKIPKDEKYLVKIVSELESKKLEIDAIMESYLGSILDPKLKTQIIRQIWQKII